jgi:hypothetical protein
MAPDFSTCPVCRQPLQLEICVTDENGCVVHESCFQKTVWNACAPSTYDQLEELLQEARELRETAMKLIARSDGLIEAYKRLTGLAAKCKPS